MCLSTNFLKLSILDMELILDFLFVKLPCNDVVD